MFRVVFIPAEACPEHSRRDGGWSAAFILYPALRKESPQDQRPADQSDPGPR